MFQNKISKIFRPTTLFTAKFCEQNVTVSLPGIFSVVFIVNLKKMQNLRINLHKK